MKFPKKESRIEGYWYNKYSPEYPMPIANAAPWERQSEFISILSKLQQVAHTHHYKGWSNCRLCSKKNGSTEYKYKNWKWPSGYLHYIVDHNVKPSDDFYTFIMGSLTKTTKPEEKNKTELKDFLSPNFFED